MDLTLYEKKTVIIWGSGYFGFLSHHLLYKLDVEVVGFCDSNPEKWGTLYCKKPIFSPEEVESLSLEKGNNLLLVLALEDIAPLKQQVESMKLSCEITSIDSYELKHSGVVLYQEILKKNPSALTQEGRDTWGKEVLRVESELESLLLSRLPKEDCITICQPPKTGDHTIFETIKQQGGRVWVNSHKPHLLEHVPFRPKKITVAIREPIGRDLSLFFQLYGKGDFLKYGYSCFSDIMTLMEEGDVNPLFYKGHEKAVITSQKSSLEPFFHGFTTHAVDVLAYDFDKEKGYSIMQNDSVDVFFFQLEKLNSLLPELSQWSGLSLTKMINDNVATDKWIGDSYEKAKKNLRFSQDYFDLSFNDPYINHCYSKEDIETFKAKWRGHIR